MPKVSKKSTKNEGARSGGSNPYTLHPNASLETTSKIPISKTKASITRRTSISDSLVKRVRPFARTDQVVSSHSIAKVPPIL